MVIRILWIFASLSFHHCFMMLQVLCSCYLSSTNNPKMMSDPALQFILFFVSCFLSIYFFICFVCFSSYFCLRTCIMLFNNSCTYLISESFLILKLSFPLFPLSCCFNSCISTPKCHVSARILSWMDL